MIFLERVEREDHVVRRHRLAVVPFRLAAQTIGDGRKIVGMADRLGQQAVFGRDFVERRRHQRFVDELGRPMRSMPFTPATTTIEIVERADRDLADDAALGRVRIDVVEVLEAGRIFDVAEQRQAVAPDRLGRLRLGRVKRGKACCDPQRRGDRGDGAALQKMSSGNCQMNIPVASRDTL